MTNAKLGSMGDPLTVEVEGRKVWICCAGCESAAQDQARQVPGPAGAGPDRRGAHRPGVGGHRHRDPEGRLRRDRARRLRGARGRPRPAVGRSLPGARRPRPGRTRRRGRLVPDRRREPPEPRRTRPRLRRREPIEPRPAPVRSAAAPMRRSDRHRASRRAAIGRRASGSMREAGVVRRRAMIEAIIEWSIRNRCLVILAALAVGDRRRPGADDHAGRRDPRPVREPGDRLHRLDGPQPPGDRGPGHLSALGQPPGAGRREGGPVVERVQLLDDQRHLRRRHRLLLRPPAGARTALDRLDVPAPGRDPVPGPRRHGRSARSSGTRSRATAATSASCGRSRTGTSATSSTASRAWPRSPRSAVRRASTRSTSTRTSSGPTAISLGEVYSAVARSNSAVGGRVIHKGNAEYLIRSVGWIQDLARPREHRRRPARRDADLRREPRRGADRARRSAGACWRRTARRSSAAWS